jgi:hypothetical protein
MEPVIKTRGQPGLSINFSYVRARVELIKFGRKYFPMIDAMLLQYGHTMDQKWV